MLLGGIVLYALQAVYADDSAKALEQVVFFYVPFALLFALLRGLPWTPRQLAWGGGALVVLALVFAAIGFWEFQTRSLLLNPKVIASNQVEEYFRVNSLFFDPNIYGRFLALVMLGLASVLLWAKRPRTPGAGRSSALAVLWGGLITTLSQSSFAALLLGLAVLAWLRWGGKVVIVPGAGRGRRRRRGDRVRLRQQPAARPRRLEVARQRDLGPLRPDARAASTSRATSRCWAGARAASTPSTAATSTARAARRPSASHTIPITVAAEQGIIGLARLRRAARAGLRPAAARRARLARCARRSPPASPRWCCTRGSTPPSSRTR